MLVGAWRQPHELLEERREGQRGQEGLSQPLSEDYPPWQQKALAYVELGPSVLRHPYGGQVRSCPDKRYLHGKRVGRMNHFAFTHKSTATELGPD